MSIVLFLRCISYLFGMKKWMRYEIDWLTPSQFLGTNSPQTTKVRFQSPVSNKGVRRLEMATDAHSRVFFSQHQVKIVKYEGIVRPGDPHPGILSPWRRLLNLPIPCRVHWQSPCCRDPAHVRMRGKAGFRSLYGGGPATECVVGVVLRDVWVATALSRQTEKLHVLRIVCLVLGDVRFCDFVRVCMTAGFPQFVSLSLSLSCQTTRSKNRA